MREFKSLNPEELPVAFDVGIYGEEPIIRVEESKRRITIHYTFPGFYLSDDSHYVEGEKIPFEQVNIAKTGFLIESGKPSLPSFGRYVQIPFNCTYKVSVNPGKPVQFDNILVAPAQEYITDSPEDDIFEYDRTFYTASQNYPEKIVDVSGPFQIDGYNALLLHVRPLQYTPARKKLTGFSTITVTIDVFPKKLDEYPFTIPESRREAYGNLFLNPKRGIEERVTAEEGANITYSADPCGLEFLIIYHELFRKAAEKLATWKNMRGLRTETASLEKTGITVDAIKSYIRKKRKVQSSRLRYVLLFGDTDMIPADKIEGTLYGDINLTDYYYSTRKDPEDSNQYILPWLSVGRLPVRTAAEGMAVVEQIISYEKNPPEDPSYYKRMAFAAYFQDKRPRDGRAERAYMKTMEYIRERMVKLGFRVKQIYMSNNKDMKEYMDGTEVPEKVKNAVVDRKEAVDALISATSKGYLIIAHRDHGIPRGWSHPPFGTDNLDAVTGETPSIFYSINCLTGRLDIKSKKDSFAEKILKIKGGAPSLIAATRKSYPWLNDHLMIALFDAMWAGILDTFPGSTASYPLKYNRLGDVLNYGKTYLPVVMSGRPAHIKDHFEIYHCIGDPTLELWKSRPLKMKVRATLEEGYLDIVLHRCPQGSVITVWHENELLKRIEPSSTHVRVSLRDTELLLSEQISVCFWAPQYRFLKVAPSAE